MLSFERRTVLTMITDSVPFIPGARYPPLPPWSQGLNLPEVSLVCVLDADAEGFLRSDTALLQTIGRATRHQAGRAVLYADRVTPSMQRALAETDRRRAIQNRFGTRWG